MDRRDQLTLIAGVLLGVAILGLWFALRRDRNEATGPSLSETPPIQTVQHAGPAANPSSSAAVAHASVEDVQKLNLLISILDSKNDNDPRLDRELRVLGEGAKELFRDKYRAYSAEKRNERGTIVFLIGRNLSTETDFEFLCEVLREPPCLSLKDCNGDPSSSGREDFDRESGEEVTLAYPQLVALQALQGFLTGDQKEGPLSPRAFKTLDCAKDSRVAAVVEKAGKVSSALTSGRPSGP